MVQVTFSETAIFKVSVPVETSPVLSVSVHITLVKAAPVGNWIDAVWVPAVTLTGPTLAVPPVKAVENDSAGRVEDNP